MSEAGPTRSKEENPITMISISESNSDYLCGPIDSQQLGHATDPLTNTGFSSIGLDPYGKQSQSTTRKCGH
ncbi:Hypothetical protein PMT_2906 [Prochlorococcus marinus str. MIT 9313]|uniref:Uncharacterized protein n=1 Tax=Prochlorococcus marinus (strain MIT 9313) TaxID=74547 RepID=B9ESS0_PROMM|nr:Hypothetical protein PMT_2906 [Prochlorococcus marinus str. MIT 9313]